MRKLTAAVVIGPLLLIGIDAAAGQASVAAKPGNPLLIAADDASASDRDSFTRKAQDQMQDWQRKVQDFDRKAEAKGKEVGDSAEHDLNKAWNDAQAASRRLQTVGAESWDGAKASFEKASRGLTDAWDRIRPQDK